MAVRSSELVGFAQGAYYVVTGAWPLVHLPSFLLVTGPKTDTWLVQTVGLLIVVIGATIALASARGRLRGETFLLAVASALALAAVDVAFFAAGRIGPVYLLDAIVEVGIVALYAYAAGTASPRLRESSGRRAPP